MQQPVKSYCDDGLEKSVEDLVDLDLGSQLTGDGLLQLLQVVKERI
jgi:hypothetical protein